jgi:hypothetical protein
MNEITRTNLQNITYMDIRELRIGNWVLDHEGEPKQVAYVGETIGLHLEQGGTQKYQHNPILSGDILDLKPIPLTSEILEKAGFVENILQLNSGERVEYNDFFEYEDGKICFGYYCNVPIRYLHQLQNLYFSITGKELEINL